MTDDEKEMIEFLKKQPCKKKIITKAEYEAEELNKQNARSYKNFKNGDSIEVELIWIDEKLGKKRCSSEQANMIMELILIEQIKVIGFNGIIDRFEIMNYINKTQARKIITVAKDKKQPILKFNKNDTI